MPQRRKEMATPWEATTRCFILDGLVVTLAGTAIYDTYEQWNAVVLICLIGGPLLTIACIATNFRWLFGLFAQGKALLNLNMAVAIGLAGAILVGVNWFSERHYRRYDATAASRHSLSSQTKELLRNLDKKVSVYTFFTADAAVFQDFPFVGAARDTLEEYKAGSPKIDLAHLDAMRDIKKIEKLLKDLKVEDVEHNSVIFACGEGADVRTKVVKTYDMVHTDYGDWQAGQEERSKRFKGEEAFSSAIMTIVDEKAVAAYCLTGHGERGIDDYQARGYSDLKTELKKSNVEVKELDLAETGKVPDDCAALIIAGPASAIPERHLQLISEYLHRQGGKGPSPGLLALLDVVRRPTGLAAVLKQFNVEALEQVPVIGVAKALTMTERGLEYKDKLTLNQSVLDYPDHEVTRSLDGSPANFMNVACVRPLPTPVSADYKASVILQGSKKTWGETNFTKILTQQTAVYDEGEDIPGPVPFGVAVDPAKEAGSRLVVIGDADFPSREMLRTGRGNLGLAINAVLWLARKTTRLGLQPVDPEYASLQLTPERKKAVKISSVYALPAGWVLFALGVWVFRTIATADSDRVGLAMRFGIALGFLLVVLAAIAYGNDIGSGVWGTLALLGLVLIGLGTIFNLEWVREVLRERQTLYGVNVVTMAALAALVLGIVNYLGGRHYDRSDNTEKKLHALSKKTVEELKKVDRPVTATLIMPGQRWNLASEHMEDTIEEFGRHCRNIGLTRIEYSEEGRQQVEALGEELKIEFDGERLPLAVFSSSSNVKQVNPDDVVQQEPMDPMMRQYGMRPPPPKLIGERCFLDAVLTVAEDKKVTVYFSVGNGERHPEKFEEQDLGEFAKLLKRANYLVKTLDLEQAETIPSDCDVLVLAAPTRTYSQKALGIVREHLRNQKGLLVLAEPEFMTGTTSGLEDLLMEYNVKLDERTVVVDMAKRVALTRQGPVVRSEPDVTVEVSEFGPHPTTRELEGESALFIQACEVSTMDEPGAGPDYQQYPGAPPRSKWNKASVVKSRSEDGWIDRNAAHGDETIKYDEGTDSKGKASIAVLVEPNAAPQRPPNPYMPPPPAEEKAKGPDLAVFGDADFASNAYVRGVPGNEKLLMNVVRWLGKQEPRKFDDINPKEIDIRPIEPDMKRLRENYYLSLFVLPWLCFRLGLGVYVLRRR